MNELSFLNEFANVCIHGHLRKQSRALAIRQKERVRCSAALHYPFPYQTNYRENLVFKQKQLVAMLAVAASAASAAAYADGWSFLDTSVNYLSWTKATADRTSKGPFGQKGDFTYLELEGGAGGDWGDFYGFFDVENPANHAYQDGITRDRRTAAKAVARFNLTKIGDYPVQLYTHVYDFREYGTNFYDQNRVVGLGTAYSNGNFWIKPFLGVHQELKAGSLGAQFNGGMGGWVLGYSFNAFGQPFMITQWHETEFGRKDQYLVMSDSGNVVTAGKTAQNGAISLWWNPTKHFTTGVSYRYADNKLGVAGLENGFIYTARYNF